MTVICYDKLTKIDTFYYSTNTLLVRECKNAIYFTMYSNDFLKNNVKFVNGSKWFEVDKSTYVVFDKLMM